MAKSFKKAIAVLLSALMVATAMPFTALAADDEHFLFAYFTGNAPAGTGSSVSQELRFATSDDGINFSPLNKNKPVITQELGTKNVRDPYIFEGQDGYYYIIGTDMDCKDWATYQSNSFVLWRSQDLVTWEDETIVSVQNIIDTLFPAVDGDKHVYKAWAPEVIYDSAKGEYLVYFALDCPAVAVSGSVVMFSMYTSDLLDETKYHDLTRMIPAVDAANIDGDIIEQDGTFYMFYKDESVDRKTVCLATSTDVAGPYTFVGTFATSSTTGAIEGCEVYTIGSDYYLVADRYGDNGKFAIYNLGNDLSKLTTKGDSISVEDSDPVKTVNATTGFQNLSARHGSVLKITEEQFNALNEAYPSVSATAVENLGLIAEYFTDSNLTYDHTGNGNTLSINGVEWWNAADHGGDWGSYGEDCAFFGQKTARVNDIFKDAGVTAETGFAVGFKGFAYRTTDQQENRRFIDITTADDMYWSGEGLRKGDGTFDAGYVFLASTGKLGSKKTDSNWDDKSGDLANYDREWHDFLVAVTAEDVAFYCDGALMATVSSNEALVNALINDGDLLLGDSAFAADPNLDGLMKNVRVYDHACTPDDLDNFTRDEMITNHKVSMVTDAYVDSISADTAQGVGYFGNVEASGFYANVLYSSKNTAQYGATTVNKQNTIYAAPKAVVMLNNGSDACFPVKFGQNKGTSRYYYGLVSETAGLKFNDYWIGYNTSFNWNTNRDESKTIGYSNDTLFADYNGSNNTTRYWWNKLYIDTNNMSFNSNNYWSTNSLRLDIYNSGSWNGSPTTTNCDHNWVTNTNSVVYVVNYKPYMDKIADVKTKYATFAANEEQYTAESANSFKMAVADFGNYDVNKYFAATSDATISQDVENCGVKMNAVINAINPAYEALECAHINTTVKNAKTPDFKNAGYTGDTYCDFCEEKIATGITINPTTPDMEAYDDILVTVNALVEAAYTPESWSALQTAITEAALMVEDALVQKDIDDATAKIQTAINNLVPATTELTVTVNVQIDSETAGTKTYTAKYGETVTIDVTDVLDGASIQKWTIEQANATSKLSMANPVYDMVVTANATVTIIATANKTEDPSYTKVKFTDRGYKTIGYGYVENTSEIDLDNVKPLTNANIVAPTLAFYDFAGWEEVARNVFVATYAVSAIEVCNVKTNVDSIEVNGAKQDKVDYDENIVITYTGSKPLGMKVGEKVMPITDLTNVHAPYGYETVEIVEIDGALNPTSMITGKFTRPGDDGKTIAAFNAMYYLPEGCTLVECGVYAKKGETFDEATLNTATKVRSQSQSKNNEYTISLQSNYSADGVTKVCGMSYVTYKTAGGTIETIYSDVAVINL